MDYICTKCNYKGQRKKVNGGSTLVSIMLWVVIPILYMLWEFRAVGSAMMSDPLRAVQSLQNSGIGKMDIAVTAMGPIYSIWRRVKKVYACPQCGEKVMLPAASGVSKNVAESLTLDDDISPDALKNIPFRWAKDVEEYKKNHPEFAAELSTGSNKDENIAPVDSQIKTTPKQDNKNNTGTNQW